MKETGMYGEKNKCNKLIRGENNRVLDELSKELFGAIKCIYIDPPYNSGERYNHYMDDKTHKSWLKDMTRVLEKLKKFICEDGSIWISIDDNEVHYLKLVADKVFGRKNFVNTVVWQHRLSRENRAIFSNNHEYVLVYCLDKKKFKKSRNLLPATDELLSRYKNPDNDERGPWQSVSAHVQAGHAVKSQFYEVVAPNGKVHKLPNGRCWGCNEEKMKEEIGNNNIWFGKDGNGVPRVKKFLKEKEIGITPETLWNSSISGTNEQAKKDLLSMFPKQLVFDTPKPEKLIKRIFEISTNENDYVMDVFLGSGTTTAVAHKMNRRYIGIEQGEHFNDIIIPRMKKVVDGGQEGVSVEMLWDGGGGFTIYELT